MAPPTTKKRRVFEEITAESQALASARWKARNEARLEQEREDRAQEREKAEDEKLGTVLAAVTQAGFTSLWDFQAALHTMKNQQISARYSKT
ncbi:hypothetical protein DFP72DRAFT_1075795 [Ephemerocybe angulata]|uniref:Uncharacterized protein n=1 Tax=Ephemerocybe angulata TaxID=980116 RepID=A0A8H6LXZ7_9AGAR|nr:hypothetical protein DFP72DRAFT_1075795 [Tulosesus angulatus]